MLNRRELIRHGLGVLALNAAPASMWARAAQAAEQQASERILVLIQLAGGNDGLNTVVPFAQDAYHSARPGIGLGRGNVLKLNDELGLHPALSGFKELYDSGCLSIVQGVGYPQPDRSHFRSMDIWQSAVAEREDTSSGWIGRTLDATVDQHVGKVPAMTLGSEKLPLSLVASKVNVPTIRDVKGYQLQLGAMSAQAAKVHREQLERVAGVAASPGSDLDFLRQTAKTAWSSAEKLQQVSASYRPAATYPSNALGQKLRTVAEIIAGDFGTRVFFVSLDGFDTHSQQAPAHQTLLTELSTAVTAFWKDLQGHRLANQVLLTTFSEFGRRVKENGSLGTDHGAASQLFVVSSQAKSGVIGTHPSLTDLDDGDLKFHTDFRSVYATLLDRWLKVDSQAVLGRRYKQVEFI